MRRVQALLPDVFPVGECPVWDDGTLLWASITEGTIHALNVATGERRNWSLASTVGSFGLCDDGRLVVALKDSVVLFDRATGETRQLATIRHPHSDMRLNDGVVGPDGAFFVGSMDTRVEKEPLGALYRVASDGSVTTVREGVTVSNGLAWSPDGRTLYHADTAAYRIDRWAFDPATGKASDRRLFVQTTEALGRPDGAACDEEGCCWSAGPSASRLNRFAPNGDLVESCVLPNFRPTMPCFGGADRRTLFVTSLSVGVGATERDAYPDCGRIVTFRAPVAGLPGRRFRTGNENARVEPRDRKILSGG